MTDNKKTPETGADLLRLLDDRDDLTKGQAPGSQIGDQPDLRNGPGRAGRPPRRSRGA